jgi:hypothetical protein
VPPFLLEGRSSANVTVLLKTALLRCEGKIAPDCGWDGENSTVVVTGSDQTLLLLLRSVVVLNSDCGEGELLTGWFID